MVVIATVSKGKNMIHGRDQLLNRAVLIGLPRQVVGSAFKDVDLGNVSSQYEMAFAPPAVVAEFRANPFQQIGSAFTLPTSAIPLQRSRDVLHLAPPFQNAA